jgi:hypothetical protein
MKLILFLLIFLASRVAFAQEPDNPLKSKELSSGYLSIPQNKTISFPPVKRGNITFVDGTKSTFTMLRCQSDSIYFFDKNSFYSKLSLTNISHITERKSNTAIAALVGGVSGFFTGIVVGGLVYPERTFWEFLSDRIDKKNDLIITKKQAPFVIGGTLAGAAIGVLVGLSKKQERTVYQKDISLNIYPGINDIFNQNTGLMLTCKITINRN